MTTIGTSEYAAAVGSASPRIVVDDGPDELLARDEPRRDVVAERQREREDRAGDDGREREREDHPSERANERPPRSAEASRSELGIRSRPA